MPLSSGEAKLIKRAIHREPEAFSDLFIKYKPIVLRHVYLLVGNREDAEDLTSETFLRAWNAMDRFEARGFSILSWLLKIAYNLRTDHFRRRRVTSVPHDLTDLEEFLDPDPLISPELVAISSSQWEPLLKAIRDLPKPQRQVIILRFLNELSYEEVQLIIGKSASNTRVLQHRALKSLQRSLTAGDFDLVQEQVTAESEDPGAPRLRVALAKD